MESKCRTLRAKLAAIAHKKQLLQAVVDLPFSYRLEAASLDLGIIVLLLANKKTGMIERVALSDTELAKGAATMSVKRFEDIQIPLDCAENSIVKALQTGKPQSTVDWKYLFVPALTAKEARLNQAGGAIAYSAVYPLPGVGDGAALIFSYYQYPDKIGDDQARFMECYSKIVAERLAQCKGSLL